MLMLTILVILLVSLQVIFSQDIANRNLKYYNGDLHTELKTLYSSGNSKVIRRRLTQYPTKSTPSTKRKPTRKPVKRVPTRKPVKRVPTRKPSRKPLSKATPSRQPTPLPSTKPTPLPSSNPTPSPSPKPSSKPSPVATPSTPYISIGSIYQTSPTTYLKFDSPTQVTKYMNEGSTTTTCTPLPYLLSSSNFLVILSMGGGSLTKTSTGLTYTSLDNNGEIEMTNVTSNPLESQCNPNPGSYKNIVSTLFQDDVYEANENFYVMKVSDSKLNIVGYNNGGSCENSFASVVGPFAIADGFPAAFMLTADNTLVQNSYYQGIMYTHTFTKTTALPSGYQCSLMPDTLIPLDVKQIYQTNIVGKLVASIVMNGNILAYYTDAFNQYGDGNVYQLRYETGIVNNSTFNIKKRYSDDRYNAKPLFFNGTELFVECTETPGNFIQGYFSGEYHDFPAEFSLGDSKSVKFGSIGSNFYVFYIRYKPNSWDIDDIYSYDMKTKVSQSLNVVAKVKDYFTGDNAYQIKSFNIKDDKIIWVYSWKNNALLYYDFNTASVETFFSLKLDEMNNVACFTCDYVDAPLVSSNNELLMIVRNGLILKNNIVLSLGPSLMITSTSYEIIGDLILKDDISGIIYYFKSNELIVYNDVLNDASVCSTKKWKQLDDGVIYIHEQLSYLTKPSTPDDVITYNGIDMKILPLDSKIPPCIPEITILKRSTNNLNDDYSFFSGSLNSDLVLIDSESNLRFKTTYQYYNTSSNTEKSITFQQVPSKPSNYPSDTNYNLLYPLSVSGVWLTENPPYLIRDNVAINISPSSPKRFVINENGAYAVSIVNDHLVKIDLSTGTSTSKISLPGQHHLAYVGNNQVIAASKDQAVVYDMFNEKTVGYIDFLSDVTEQCGTRDWNFDGMANNKRGLSVAITCYNTDDDSNNHFINLYQLNL